MCHQHGCQGPVCTALVLVQTDSHRYSWSLQHDLSVLLLKTSYICVLPGIAETHSTAFKFVLIRGIVWSFERPHVDGQGSFLFSVTV